MKVCICGAFKSSPNNGIKICTTERYNGKAVYTKLVNLGTIAEDVTVDVASSVADVVDAKLTLIDGDCYYFDGEYCSFYMSLSNGECCCVLEHKGETDIAARIVVKYTKE